MSKPSALILHCDQHAADSFARSAADRPGVLLVGGYLGYPNFGDILQLRGVIAWHRAAGRDPILVCDRAAVTDADFTARLRRWFGVDKIIYWSDPELTAEPVGLISAPEDIRVPYLHLYGGGFLNRLWGPRMLGFVELLHKRFGVGHYVMSGQQAEEGLIGLLREHIERCRPIIAGGRDDETVRVLKLSGMNAAYSFDDAAEMMTAFCAAVAGPAQDVEAAPKTSGAERVYFHLNVSPYAADAPDAVSHLGERVSQVLRSTRETTGHDTHATLLHAYNDERVHDVADTLGVVLRLGDRFPMSSYRGLHLGRMACELSLDGEAAFTTPLLRRGEGIALSLIHI